MYPELSPSVQKVAHNEGSFNGYNSPQKPSPRASLHDLLPSAQDDDNSGMSPATKKIVVLVFKIILLLLVVAYSIGAFVYDFEKARAIFVIEILAIVVFVLIQINNRFGEDILRCRTACEDFVNGLYDNMVIRGIGILIYAGLIVGSALYYTWDEKKRLISALGLVFFVVVCYLFSWKRKHVIWRPVLWGFTFQYALALFILRSDAGFECFNFLGNQIAALLAYTNVGAQFVFGYVAMKNDWITAASVKTVSVFNATNADLTDPSTWTNTSAIAYDPSVFAPHFGIFAFAILPTIIFFGAFVSILYYIGVMQAIIKVMGSGLAYCMGTSLSESVNAAGNIFVGQTEAPFLIKPFIAEMTMSELHAVMTGGFATIAGGVMAVYISMGVSAPNLLAASVMSAPAALAISKILYPETEESATKAGAEFEIDIGSDTNAIEAAANGASQGTVIAGQIAGMLIAFLSLIAMLDAWTNYLGVRVGYTDASFTNILGKLFYPIAWLMGVDADECEIVGELIAIKIIANEFVAYSTFVATDLSSRGKIITTYALCGFSNLGSMGIQIAGIGNLAPQRIKDISKVVFSAMIAGNIACFMTACIAGMLFDTSALQK